jgi:LysR family transcriptional regulator, cell division regulator
MGAITPDDGSMDARLLPDLLVFLEAARAGSLTQAARRLNTVQPNVTARIRKLEQALGAKLLRRHARGVQPTPAGEAALAIATRLGGILEDLRREFRTKHPARRSRIRVGSIETIAASHLQPIVVGFSRRHPDVEISVHTASSLSLLKQLRERELDAVFVSRAVDTDAVSSQPVFRDELTVIAASALRSLNKLLEESRGELKIVVQRLGCSYTARLLSYLAERSTRKYRLVEAGTLESVLSLVAGGVGIATLPRAFVDAQRPGHGIRHFALPRAIRFVDTHLATRVDEPGPPLLREFAREVQRGAS